MYIITLNLVIYIKFNVIKYKFENKSQTKQEFKTCNY